MIIMTMMMVMNHKMTVLIIVTIITSIALYYISLLSGLGNICSIGWEPPIGVSF